MRKPIVDQRGFDAIECNRCGKCCEGIQLPAEFDREGWWHRPGPLGFLECFGYWHAQGKSPQWFSPLDTMLFFGQLQPFRGEDGYWRYRCGSYERREGQGVCAIHAHQPYMCSGFPYFRPCAAYQGCSWDVELIDFEVVHGVC